MALQEKGCFDFNTKALLLKDRHDVFAGRRKARLERKQEVGWVVAAAAVSTLVAAIVVGEIENVVIGLSFHSLAALSFILFTETTKVYLKKHYRSRGLCCLVGDTNF